MELLLTNANIEFAIPFLSSFILFMLVGWFVFSAPYQRIRNSSKLLKEAKSEAERIAQFPINNPNPIIQISFDGDIIYANPASYKNFPDLNEKQIEHDALKGLEGFMIRTLENQKEKHIITREISYENIVYRQTITFVIANGRKTLVFYCYDITAIKEAQRRARIFESVIANAEDGVIITKADINNPEILYANDAVTEISGYKTDDLIGQIPDILQGKGINQQIFNELKECLIKGNSYKCETHNRIKNGVTYWVDISIVPVTDENGKITHFATIERDVTGNKIIEKEMQINREAAEVANRAKGDFLANMSHELRTPMNGIIGLSALLVDMDLTREQTELIKAVNSSSHNLLTLLNDILDFSKIEAGELTLENIPFDIRKCIRQTVDLLGTIASRKGIILESTINPIVPERIMGDPARLQQIMNNLISNAIKFTEIGYVRIDITSMRDDEGHKGIRISVEDTGIGIASNKQGDIFQKFTQADVSTARKYGGSGLGLTITKELVDMMKGSISLDSVEGKGTTFYVELPVEEISADKYSDNLTSNNAPISINTDARILVVDDHPVNLLFMQKVLNKLGFKELDDVCNGKEAIELAQKNKYDLILMDCQMPDIDGFEASTIIRDREDLIGETKIIAVTADAMKGAREKCLDAGMNDYISKPIDIGKLEIILSKWLPDNSGESYVAQTNDIEKTRTDSEAIIMDWERLNMFTDGNKEEENELIDMFINYAGEPLDDLKSSCQTGHEKEWKAAAHKLKGSAANLGAEVLCNSCLNAEVSSERSKQEKEKILIEITASYNQLIDALDSRRVSS